jgi:hypothetical protein
MMRRVEVFDFAGFEGVGGRFLAKSRGGIPPNLKA